MTDTPYYFRKADHLYPVSNHPEYWFYVGRSEQTQVIIGLLDRTVAVLRFSPAGDLLGPPEVLRSFDATGDHTLDEDELRELVEAEVETYRSQHGLDDEMVFVKRFRFPDRNAGIDDLPEEVQEVVQHPSRFSPADRADLEDTLQAWKDDDLYVLWWGQSFTVDADGLVTAS
ncbi:MAG: hypothetical protein K2P78_09600 [Gemmataceae bacterium]|nr:hypothetical protein [Gemmataceae bacterium]